MEKQKRGFAAMDEERHRQIASQGGITAHEQGTAHEFTAEEASQAGQKGGATTSRDKEHMSRIGKKGGAAAQRNRKARKEEQQP